MPLLRINATDSGLLLHHDRSDALPRVARATDNGNAPTIVMIHGYKYSPGDPLHCPHAKLFGPAGADWPRALGYGGPLPSEGLGVAFGWSARGPLHRIHRRASGLGPSLARLLRRLKTAAPRRPVHVIAHSLGSEIALSALPHLPCRTIDRMLLLTGASFTGHAEAMLASPAGRTADVFNIVSRENDLFDLAFETLVRPVCPGDRAIGQGIRAANVTNLQLDCDQTLAALARYDVRIAAAERRICHWSSYKRPGVMALYAQMLRRPESLPLDALRRALPDRMDPRWSRLPQPPSVISLWERASSTLAQAPRVLKRKAALLTGAPVDPKRNTPAY
ncbi:alpha/beta hydrolase [uncultured Roseobacter sp.]|uniref:alpha/beta hydrolase n=1 Tax=uncultured Roseobacter sp. TaxID=114847 RepID=UPI002632642B|nr:alpha/beta hydrolase [uncultured Roseobacter sp.]